MDVSVAVVDSETSGNIGTIARAMKNFGFEDLLVVDPPEIEPGGEAYGYAAGARDVLENRRNVSFDTLVQSHHTVAFTSTTPADTSNLDRHPFYTVDELGNQLPDTSVALVFGRETVGLSNAELRKTDSICTIPANPEYASMNLGQAATVTLYELSKHSLDTHEPDRETASPRLVNEFHNCFRNTLEPQTDGDNRPLTAMKRVIGRANPTKPELETLIGAFKKIRRD